MSIVYFDESVLKERSGQHPALVVDKDHPCCRIVREAIDGKSVFHWNREQAFAMYTWWVEGYQYGDLIDEFGERISSYDFKATVEKSYYLVQEGKKSVPSTETIAELYAAITMEREMLKAIGEEKEEE